MNSQEFVAKNVKEAEEKGLKEMGISRDNAEIEVIDKGGLLKKARIRITDRGSEGQKALTFIENLTDLMKVNCTCELEEDDKTANIEIISLNSGVIIGHRGDVLDAIQYLSSIVANENETNYKRIVVDCENYRARRVETLETLATRMADKAIENNKRIRLESMNAFERRIIHSKLSSDERVETASLGEEPYRYLTIAPKGYRPRRNNRDRNFGNHSRYGRNDNRNRDNRNDRNDRGERRSAPRAKKVPSNFSSFGYIGNSNEKKD